MIRCLLLQITSYQCHPSITIGTPSNKIKRFDNFNSLQRDTGPGSATDGETMIAMPSIDDEHDDDDDDESDDDDDVDQTQVDFLEPLSREYAVTISIHPS